MNGYLNVHVWKGGARTFLVFLFVDNLVCLHFESNIYLTHSLSKTQRNRDLEFMQ